MSDKQIVGSVMVVGGGIAGIQASLDLADSGYRVYMIEKSSSIGGVMSQLDKTFPTNDCSMCIISPKLVEAGRHLNIDIHTMSEVQSISGEAGNFNVKLKVSPRFVDINKCTSCGECSNICPVVIKNEFDQNLSTRKAIFKKYPQAMPGAFTIDKKGRAPCKEGCPVHPSIQGFIALINDSKYKEAFELFRLEHPMPGICGRVCHHPCEDFCTRSKIDQPVSIMALHRFLADWAINNKITFVPKVVIQRKEKIGVIGSGPAGLSCAYFLAIDGFDVTVFEKNKVLGGMLVTGIPPYRLPRKIINEEISTLKKIGVKFKIGIEIGVDLTIEDLRQNGYKAFFIGIGAQKCKKLGMEKENKVIGIYSGIEYLNKINMGEKVNIGNEVAVIGGGNVAIDVVRTALRQGSKNPFILYRRSKNEMPANTEEIEECLEEDIDIKSLTQPVSIIEKNGRIHSIKCIKMKLGDLDESGRRKPEKIKGSDFLLKVDSLISAVGQEIDWSCLKGEDNIIIEKNGTIKVNNNTLQSNISDIFAGGDAVTGPATVIDAIAYGKKASKFIKNFILNGDLENIKYEEDTIDVVQYENIELDNISKSFKEKMILADVNSRKKDLQKEVQFGLIEEQVKKEVKRCLSCGICSECYMCVDNCLAGAIDHSMTFSTHEISVGAIILAPGFTPFDPKNYESYNYLSHKNILTSLEFERILSASGPYQGHLVRPSDGVVPKKIAWLQCVGSRDINNCDNEHCSSVCCMYANKQAIIAKEHTEGYLDTAIFFMDMRTFGKDFDKYVIRGENEHEVRLVRSRIHSLIPSDKDNLKIVYLNEFNESIEEIFDLVILSIGLAPCDDAVKLAQTMDVELDTNMFVNTKNLTPSSTNISGIFVCGAFQEPKDIPSSVIDASSSSALASELLSTSRWTLTRFKELPSEVDISKDDLRIGVFVCNCGINIGGIADVPLIRDYALSLPNVVHVDDRMFACSQDSQDYMKNIIHEKRLNRIVVASCSPRTHEPLFQETIREAGLNRYLFEMANIRDQNTWVHMKDPEKATIKAKELVRMAVASVSLNKPLYQFDLKITGRALVVGGGVSGIEASLSIANQGYEVILVEKSQKLGGNANYLLSTWKGESIPEYIEKKIDELKSNSKIKIYIGMEVEKTNGVIGNFKTKLISKENKNIEEVIDHGITIIATGGKEYKPTEYLYGKNSCVYTHLDLDVAISQNDSKINESNNIVFIQCVGSRNDERPYCSKVCCTHTLKSAILLKKEKSNRKILVVYRDIRSYGFREKLYREARELGILFIRYDLNNLPKISEEKEKLLFEHTDNILSRPIEFTIDLLVLATGILPNKTKKICENFKIPINNEGFFVEAHAKLRPVDFSSDGIFLSGLAHCPKPLEESIAQSKASASRAMTILSKKNIKVGGIVASVDSTKCSVCLTCVRTCPYNTPKIIDDGYAKIEPAQCHGCGICVSECPGKAITLKHFTDEHLIAKSDALFLNL